MKHISISYKNDYSNLFAIYKEGVVNENICIDISSLKFVNPYDVVLLVQSVIYIRKHNPFIDIQLKTNTKSEKYLNDIRLFECRLKFDLK